MQSLVEHARTFTQHVAANAKDFERLADGQTPEALFVTCSDSRVVPSLITGARPGQLFELRTAGNIVPPYPGRDRPTGEAATIEYALCVLQVRDIIVCGHSHCGAVGAILRGDDLSAMPAVRHWLEHSTDGRTPPPTPGTSPARSRPTPWPSSTPCGATPRCASGSPRAPSACTPGTTRCTPAPSACTGPSAAPSSPAFDGSPSPTSPRSAPAGRDRTHKGSHRDFREGPQEPPRRTP